MHQPAMKHMVHRLEELSPLPSVAALQAMGTALQTVTSMEEGLGVIAEHVLQGMQGQEVWCTLFLEADKTLEVQAMRSPCGEVKKHTHLLAGAGREHESGARRADATSLEMVAHQTVLGRLTVGRRPETPTIGGNERDMLGLFAQMGALTLAQIRHIARGEWQAERFARLSDSLQRAQDETLFLTHLLTSAEDGILGTDLEQRIRFCNRRAETLLGCAGPDMLGKPLASVFPAAAQQEIAQRCVDMLQHHTSEAYTFEDGTEAGNTRRFCLTMAPIRDAGEAVRGIAATCRDMTERTRLEDELHQAQKMEAIGVLAGGIAHDFNNILTAIHGFTDLALDNIPPDSAPWRHLHGVLSASTRAKELVQQILTFSRRTGQACKPIQLSLLVQEALRLLRASLPSNIEIRHVLNQDAGVVSADPTQIHQVLMNLSANAEHAMRKTGGMLEIGVDHVEVDATWARHHAGLQSGPHVRVTVRDTGSGIAPEVQKRIFEPFFTTKPVGEGTGLGLAIVHRIIGSHHGAITVESTPGAGTTFSIYLPRSGIKGVGLH
ncbi:MAG: ATP-binding protein [Candidatus Tectomicrobia bacterium]